MQQQEGQNNLYVWTVMEEGIEGKCENTYQVTEIPEYMVHDYEKGMFQPELCQGKKFWQVLRTRDITKCTDRSVFLSSKGHKNCVVGNCEPENSKQTQTRYFACGLTAEDMQLHGMINEGEMRQNVVAFQHWERRHRHQAGPQAPEDPVRVQLHAWDPVPRQLSLST